MITVVIPTMWRYPPFLEFLKDLLSFPLVAEVVLINNDQNSCPDKNLNHPKLVVVNPEWNIGVNPAWNIGVEISSNEIVCIANDDILFDFKLFSKILPYFNHNTGAICISGGEEKFGQVPVTNGNIEIVPWLLEDSQNYNRFGFGSLFFIEKNKWIPIPQEMKIYYGDDWMIDTQIICGRTNYSINNCFNYTPRATTCKEIPNLSVLLDYEKQVYSRELELFRNKYTGIN